MKLLNCNNCNAELDLTQGTGNVIACGYCGGQHVLENSLRAISQVCGRDWLIFLKDAFVRCFDKNALEELCYDLFAQTGYFGWEDMDRGSITMTVLTIIQYSARRGQTENLVEYAMSKNRPFALAVDSYVRGG